MRVMSVVKVNRDAKEKKKVIVSSSSCLKHTDRLTWTTCDSNVPFATK